MLNTQGKEPLISFDASLFRYIIMDPLILSLVAILKSSGVLDH